MATRWWFKHDYRARSDTKLLELEFEFGMHEAYSLWFRTLEIMGEYGGKLQAAKLPLYASLIRVDSDLFGRFISYCVAIGLLHNAEGFIQSKRFLSDYEQSNEISKTNSKNANMRWQKDKECDGNATAYPTASEPEKAPEPKEPKKPKTPAITEEIVNHWNALATKNKCAKITSDVAKAIEKRAKEYSADEIKSTISNYLKTVQADETKFTYRWNLMDFLNRANGFPVFYGDEADILSRYGCKCAEKQPELAWSHPFPKPTDWDQMSLDERRKYLNDRRKK